MLTDLQAASGTDALTPAACFCPSRRRHRGRLRSTVTHLHPRFGVERLGQTSSQTTRSHTPRDQPGIPCLWILPLQRAGGGRRLPERLLNKFPRPPPSHLLHPVAEPVSASPCLSGPSGSIPGRSRLRPGGERGSPHPGHRVVAPAPPPLAGCSSALRPRAPVSRRRRRRRSVCLPALRSPGPRRGTRRKEPRSDPGLARALPTLSARPGSSARRRRRRRPACIRARGGSARPCCSGTPPACAARSRPARVARSPRRCSDPGPRPRDCRRRPRAPLGRVPGQVSESAE